MTVVPVSYQLCGWIPAWWSGAVGGDDLLDLLGPDLMTGVAPLRSTTRALTAYSRELGVAALPGPKAVTEAAVAAGEAVILHGAPGAGSHVLIPGLGLFAAPPARPAEVDLRLAASEFTQAVVHAEHEIRSSGVTFDAQAAPPRVRPLPPGTSSERKALLVRAVRVWTAVAALPSAQRTPALQDLERCCARAALAAYIDTAYSSRAQDRSFA